MTDFATFQVATAVAADLHEKLEAIRVDAVKSRTLKRSALEELISAEDAAARALRRLLRLTQEAANAEATTSSLSAE